MHSHVQMLESQGLQKPASSGWSCGYRMCETMLCQQGAPAATRRPVVASLCQLFSASNKTTSAANAEPGALQCQPICVSNMVQCAAARPETRLCAQEVCAADGWASSSVPQTWTIAHPQALRPGCVRRKHVRQMEGQGLQNPHARLFSNPAGDYGSMVNERVGTSNWESSSELGDTWASRNSFSYGR